VWDETERGLAFVRKAKFRDVADILVAQQRFIQNMRGRTASFSTFDDEEFDQASFEKQLTPQRMTAMVCWYWITKGQARFISGDFDEARSALERARQILWVSHGRIQSLDYHLYSALSLAAGMPPGDGLPEHREQLSAHCRYLALWAETYPPTFADKHLLVTAEIARIEGRDLDAERLYEAAIRAAHENGFVQHEAMANEIAARFYAARGFEKIAYMSTCGTPGTATFAGEPMGKCGNSMSYIRTSGRKGRVSWSYEHDWGIGRTPGSRYCHQSIASSVEVRSCWKN
jgi:hypothetical protein